MATNRHRSGRIAAGAALLALLLSACGGGGDEATTPASGAASGSAAAVAGEAGREVLLDAQQLTTLDQQVVYPKKKPAQVTSVIVTLEPGQETGWHLHKVPLFVHVLEGTVTVEYDAGVTKEYPAGSTFMEAEDIWHNGSNLGDGPVRILTVYFGAEGAKNTVERSP